MGFAIDQQVPVQKAFAGPLALKQRVGTLDPRKLAKLDLERAFREKPAIHRFPGAMASRVQELAAVVAEDYGGDASRIWAEAADTADLQKRLGDLPGFGPMKVTALGSVLALRFGVATATPLVPAHPCLGRSTRPRRSPTTRLPSAPIELPVDPNARSPSDAIGHRRRRPSRLSGWLVFRVAAITANKERIHGEEDGSCLGYLR